MTAKQKLVLIIFGVLDLAVVVGLGAIVVNQSRPTTAMAPAPPEDPCSQVLLDALSSTGDVVSVAWASDAAMLTVVKETTEPGLPDEQQLWLVLDRLPAPLPEVCPLPNAVTLSLRLPHIVHTTRLEGTDLAAWLAGTQSDTDLAARALYRASHIDSSP